MGRDGGEGATKRAKIAPASAEVLASPPASVVPAALQSPTERAAASVAAAARGSKQLTLVGVFKGSPQSTQVARARREWGQPAHSQWQAVSPGAALELRREVDDERRRSAELIEALRAAHERAETAEAEVIAERARYKRELAQQLSVQCKSDHDQARRSLAEACLKVRRELS